MICIWIKQKRLQTGFTFNMIVSLNKFLHDPVMW